MKEQIWKWYRERGCSDSVVELAFMINNYDSFKKYYLKHICEYICGGKWMVQRVPYSQNVVDRLESCATTIRNELYNIMNNHAANQKMALFDDWRIQHVAMKLVDVLPSFQGKHVDIVDDTPLVVTHIQPSYTTSKQQHTCHVTSKQQRRGGYPSV